jgi:uncharacterized surface protein with fasciclin (FAS1) repeats
MHTMKRIAAAGAIASALTMTAACGGSSSGDTTAKDGSSSPTASSSPAAPRSSSSSAMAAPAAELVGPGCAAYAKQVPNGAGSVQGMAKDPVATAASNNPLLKTLVAAVSGKLNPKVNLVDTLNGGKFTVFAPVDSAFAKLPKATVKSLSTPKGAATLRSVLTYHVLPGQIAPNRIDGSHKTVQGGNLRVTGSGNDLKVNGSASVICGGVQTANATVYLIDSVLMPTM